MAAEDIRSGWLGKLAVAVAVTGAMAVTGFYDLGHFDHNDFQYGVAPVLLDHLRLYQDFSFDQTPLAPWLGLAVLKITGTERLYTSLRLISLLCVWASAGIGILICRKRAARKDLVSLLFIAGFVAMQPLVVIGGEIGNYSLGLVLSAAALWVFLERREWAVLAGLFAGLAVSAKLSNVYQLAAFGLLYFAGAERWRRTAWFKLGAAIGIAPVLYYFLRAPRPFWFENVSYHYLINIYRGVPFHIAVWPLALVALPVLAASPLLWAEAWGVVALLAAAMIGLVTPGILFPQYWAPADFFLLLLGCLIFARRVERWEWMARGVAVVAVLCAVIQAGAMAAEALAQARGGFYGLGAVNGLRGRISAAMAPIEAAHPRCHGDLISAFAAAAVGSGLELAPISSEGPFMMRLDPVLKGRAEWFRDYSDVNRYLSARSVLMVGYDPGTGFEGAMRAYAEANGFTPIGLGSFLGHPVMLELPPGCGGIRAAFETAQ